jgi:hypothetical protein
VHSPYRQTKSQKGLEITLANCQGLSSYALCSDPANRQEASLSK